jgi:hypothetical protein
MFNLNLFKQKNISKNNGLTSATRYEDESDFIPVISGGLVATTQKWWKDSGGFDPGMRGALACLGRVHAVLHPTPKSRSAKSDHVRPPISYYIYTYIYILYMNMIYAHYHTYFILLAVIFPICSNVFSTLVIVHPVE